MSHFPSPSLPSTNDATTLSDWLNQLWQEKEKRLKNFYTEKSFPGEVYVDTMIDKIKLVVCTMFWLVFPVLVIYFYATLSWTWCVTLLLTPSLVSIFVSHIYGGWDILNLKLRKPKSVQKQA